MYDKQVRRRRLALAGFVVASLLLLTVYFGESTNGTLHSVQRGALSVLGPIQEGAHRALKPFRDLFGWVGDTLDAKKERDQLADENEDLRKQVTQLQAEQGENEELKRLLQINVALELDQYDPIRALVTARNANLFYSKVQIEKGSSSGVALNDPVVNGDGLVGRVTTVTRGYSIVTLVTDESFATGVKVLGANQHSTIRPNPNRPGELELLKVQDTSKISRGQQVVTAGSTNLRLRSFYPRDLPVGTVSRIEVGEGSLDSRVEIKPAVDIGTLEWVEVLRKHEEPTAVATLP
jgi:rod shape-determining protein MreC